MVITRGVNHYIKLASNPSNQPGQLDFTRFRLPSLLGSRLYMVKSVQQYYCTSVRWMYRLKSAPTFSAPQKASGYQRVPLSVNLKETSIRRKYYPGLVLRFSVAHETRISPSNTRGNKLAEETEHLRPTLSSAGEGLPLANRHRPRGGQGPASRSSFRRRSSCDRMWSSWPQELQLASPRWRDDADKKLVLTTANVGNAAMIRLR